MPGIGIGISPHFQQKKSLSSYWATRTPSALVLTSLSTTSIKVDWTNTAEDIDGHSVEVSQDGVNYSEVDTVSVGSNSLTHGSLTQATSYYYRVRAYKGTEYSPYCNVAVGETIFLPSDIAGLYSWHDISQETGFNDGDTLNPVTDFSGNGIHLNTTSTGIYKTNILNGHPSIRYNGSSQFSRRITITVPTKKTVFTVANRLGGADTIVTQIVSVPYYSIAGTELSAQASQSFTTSGANITTGTPFILSAIDDGPNTSKIFANGGYGGTAGILFGEANGTAIWWGRNNTGTVFLNGDIFEGIIYGAVLSDANRRRIEKYLSWKYGISLVPL